MANKHLYYKSVYADMFFRYKFWCILWVGRFIVVVWFRKKIILWELPWMVINKSKRFRYLYTYVGEGSANLILSLFKKIKRSKSQCKNTSSYDRKYGHNNNQLISCHNYFIALLHWFCFAHFVYSITATLCNWKIENHDMLKLPVYKIKWEKKTMFFA